MNRYRKLINNSIIFTIGNFGSKIISFLMVPLYTHLLSTSEYGTVDLISTTIGLLLPLLTLELGQAALRYAVETKNEIEKNKIFSILTVHILIITILGVLALTVFYYLNLFNNYGLLFIVLLISRLMNNLYSEYIRGIGLIKEFAINGILMTLITVVSNIILLVYLGLREEGYIISLIIATLGSNLYLFYAFKGKERLSEFNVDKSLQRKMLRYSIPTIPNSAMWWIISGSTRYFILYFAGATGNGLYAVANKIPSLISMVTGIFSQSWQLSSFEEYESKDKNQFYSNTFNIYWVFLFLSGSAILIILKPLLSFLVEESFYESWKIVPILLYAVIYQSFASFLGTNYSASKKTKGAFTTSVYAGVVSLISSIIFIPLFGTIGASISSALSFLTMFGIRMIDTRKYVEISINLKEFLFSNLIYIVQTIALFTLEGIKLIILEALLFLSLLLINKNVIMKIFNVFLRGRKNDLE